MINFITNPDIFHNFKRYINENNNSKEAPNIKDDIKDEQKIEKENLIRCKIKKRNQDDYEDFKEEKKNRRIQFKNKISKKK